MAPNGRTTGMSSRKVAVKKRIDGIAIRPVRHNIDAGARTDKQCSGR
jgi:hypothetical protein